MGWLRLGEHEDRFDFFPFSKLVMVLTLDFDPSGIFPGVGFVSSAAG